MLVAEIFYSLQGEGELTGVPSVFIRTAGCNLRCHWCDTLYASWHPEGKDLSHGEILDHVRGFAPARHCVITGGEPMVARGIHDLAAALREEDWHITLETAATVAPEGIACDLASLSPKLSNSTPQPGEIEDGWIRKHEAQRLRPDIISAWLASYPFQLKFVVTESPELEEIEILLGQLTVEVPPHKVLLMPEAVSQEELRQRTRFLVEACKKRGYRFCHRLHIELFGNRRGT